MAEVSCRSLPRSPSPHPRAIASQRSLKHQNGAAKHKNSDTPTTSKQSQSRFMGSFCPLAGLRAVYHLAPQAKYFALVLVQDLVRACCYDIYSYCMMLQLLANLSFEGFSETSVKIAITVFHIGSKFFNSNRPRLLQLIAWSHYLVSARDIIACQEQILKGLNYTLPTHDNMGIDQIQVLCFQLQQTIFALEY